MAMQLALRQEPASHSSTSRRPRRHIDLHPVTGVSGLAYSVLRVLGVPGWVRTRRDAAVILCYHNVVDDTHSVGDPGLHLAVSRFEAQLEWLSRHYTVISLPELGARVRERRSLRRLAILTFDDAYRGFFELALPRLRHLGLPATVFVVTDAADRGEAFWWDDPHVVVTPNHRDHYVRDLAGDSARVLAEARGRDTQPATLPQQYLPAPWTTIQHAAAGEGLVVGAHTVRHRALPYLGDADLEWELRHARDVLADKLGAAPAWLSFPYGLHDARVRAAARNAGYEGALTLAGTLARDSSDPWELPRVNIPVAIGPAAFEAWLAGIDLGRWRR
jgi:peptidoglycan/xylan/chitin deacetylase (PgdA/CDA1 family)